MNNVYRTSILLVFLFIISSFSFIYSENIVKTGLDVIKENPPDIIKGKNIGLITNYTAVDNEMRSALDVISSLKNVNIVAAYSPEHGFTGGKMGHIDNSEDKKRGIRIFSLHGNTKIPTKEMLKGVDLLIFDIQDIGVRSYTYISTMKNCMVVAAKNRIPFVVLDRPNPLGGIVVDGPVLDMSFASFIGAGPIAYVHGMTIGEIALFLNTELKIKCNLTVVPMVGWERRMDWQDTKLNWIPTSPHIPESDTPLFYATTGILGETPLVNIGVGYTLPFKIVGAPWIDAELITQKLNEKNLPGVSFHPFYFTPFYHHYNKDFCQGFKIIVTNKDVFMPVSTGYHIIETLIKLYPEDFKIGQLSNNIVKMFNQANGTDRVLKMLLNKDSAEMIIKSYEPKLTSFKEKRKKYLLYQ